MSGDKVGLEELLKTYQNASTDYMKYRTVYIPEKADKGIYLLQRIYTEVYAKQTGLKKRVRVGDIISMAIENMVNSTIAKIREEAEKSETT